MIHPNLAGKRVLVVEDEMLVALLVEDVPPGGGLRRGRSVCPRAGGSRGR